MVKHQDYKENKLKYLKPELLYTILFQFTTLVGGLLLIKLLAVSLSTHDYGYYALITSIIALVLMFPFSALMQGVSRYVSIYQKRLEYKSFFTSTILGFLSLSMIYVLLALSLNIFISLDDNWNDIYMPIVFLTLLEVLKVFYRTVNNANRERKNLFLSVLSEFTIKLTIIGSVYLLGYVNIKTILYVFILANFTSILIMLYKNKAYFDISSVNVKKSKIFFLRVWIFSSPLVIWSIFGWLRDMSNRWYLDYFLDKEQVALFVMLSSISMIAPTALLGIIGGYFMPIIYQKENQHRGYTRDFLYKLLPIVLMIFSFSFVITYIFKNEIILIIADEKYLSISWMLPWMYLVFCLYTLSMMATYELFAHKQTKKLILSSIIPGVISLFFGYFLIKQYGIEGALYNYIITYLSYTLLTFYVVVKYIRSNKLEV